MDTKVCNKCKIEQPLDAFYVTTIKKSNTQRICSPCKKCRLARMRSRYHITGPRSVDVGRAQRAAIKKEVFDTLGGVCECCGETNYGLLTVDHINNDGNKDRNRSGKKYTGDGLYYKVKREGYPRDKYRILCWTCNMGRAQNGGICPHQQEETIIDIYIRENNELKEAA